ncbi:unnamed protein product [Euphydryas editha]|uniref:Uncharacterized protein n=1 Tax=Euphydryas editha TaxID=104508 RepID=A0AAU9TH49_EUPED|nr:unnamed protein product [Euphydryas editha]
MSVQRTPPNASLASGSGSVPNLTIVDDDCAYMNQRKRKDRTDEYDYKSDLLSFRTDIMKFLQEFGKSQNESLTQIRDQISEITNEVKTFKITVEHQFAQITKEIETIKTNNSLTQDKFTKIENEISKIREQVTTSSNPKPLSEPLMHENLILELKDRVEREKNLIIVGIAEKNDKNLNARRTYDDSEVIKLLTIVSKDVPKPIKCMRLGKYVPNKNRPIKVYFSNSETPKQLLRHKRNLPQNIQMYNDQTPKQKQYIQSLKNELQTRQESGEQDLIIKYIKGMPTIIKNKITQKN